MASEADFDVDNQETKIEKVQTDKANVANDATKDKADVANDATKDKADVANDPKKDKADVADDATKDKVEDDQDWGDWNKSKKSWDWKIKEDGNNKMDRTSPREHDSA